MFASLLEIGRTTRRSLENPALSLNDPEAWDDVFGTGTDSGIRFTRTSGFKYAPVWRAVSMISGDIARLPLNVYRRQGEGREIDRRHPAFRVVRRMANSEMSSFRFWRTMLVNACYWNHAEALIVRNGRGDVAELLPLLPDRTKIKRVFGRLVYVTEYNDIEQRPQFQAFPAEDILSIKGPMWDQMEPPELVAIARDSWALGLAEQGFASKFFASGGRSGGILELPLGSTKNYADKLEEGFRKTYETTDSWFKTVILRDGARFHAASQSPEQAQAVEAREEQVRDVARWFSLQPSRLGVTGSVSYNSRSEDNQEYLDSTLAPWMADIQQECQIKLLSAMQFQADSHFFEHNPNSLLTMNPLKRYQTYAIGVRNHVLLPNEARKFENLNPIEGGDEFPSQQAESDGGADQGEEVPPRGEGGESEESDDGEDRSLERRIAHKVADHARAKARKGHRAYGEWLAGDLVSHREECHDLTGDDEVIDQAMVLLQEAENVPVKELQQTVDRAATLIERFY